MFDLIQEKQEAQQVQYCKHLISKLFDFLNRIPKGIKIDRSQIDQFFLSNVVVERNGALIAESSQKVCDLLCQQQQRFPYSVYSLPIEEPMVDHDRVALYFIVTLANSFGEKRHLQTMVTLKMREGKISEWHEVQVEDRHP